MTATQPVAGASMLDLVDYVLELTTTHHHREHYDTQQRNRDGTMTTIGRNHTIEVPGLLDQLKYAAPSSEGDERMNTGYGSRPPARLEALDTLVWIDLEAARWVKDLGEDDPSDTADCVRLLGSLMPSADRVTRKAVARDVRRWWTQARIVTGFDSPAWKPDNTCPLCGVRGGLRVKLADRSGLCVECRQTWTPETVALLADHIRAENHDEVADSHAS